MTEIVKPIISAVIESLLAPIKKHIGYAVSYTEYVRDMRTKIKELDDTRGDVKKHMDRNKNNRFNIPSHVPTWLEAVDKIDARVKNIPSDVDVCFNLKIRYELGRKAFKINQDIDSLMKEKSNIEWDDLPIPLGEVDSVKASISTPSSDHNDFESRELTFKEALKALEPNHNSKMIALCGMGGVGKTTMMEKLKKVAEEKRLFNLIVKVVIGEKLNIVFVQDAVADYLGINLTQKSVPARAAKLRESFEHHSKEGKNKILVIIDDVWEFIDLNVFGLSPLPNEGVGFKLLLTSRNSNVCSMMGVEANSIFNVGILNDLESQSLFLRFVKSPDDDDLTSDLYKIGDDIVRKCQGLPIAIKTIACTLKGKKKPVWEDARTHLEHYDIHKDVSKVFELSYNNLKDEETKSVLLLCGLYPEDFEIPMEELVRYGWGLKLFDKVYKIREARFRLNACIDQLVSTNLLIKSQRVEFVKLHDLTRVFVLGMLSIVEHATSVVNHDNLSNWPKKDMSKSCKRISLTCTGLSEFPRDFKYPDLLLLNLRKGDNSIRFPLDFYGEMNNLEVISFENISHPLLPTFSTNLRMLSLHNCNLINGFSEIGNLLNLEVLSVTNSNIQKLPSTLGNLKKLKLMDLTGCIGLHITKGVLKNLVNLEELYMRVRVDIKKLKAVVFTYDNYNELVERSKNLSTLEIEFFEYSSQLKNMSYEKLERFKISVGCLLEKLKVNMHLYENTLMLNTNKIELLESKLYELFEKTELLQLNVDGMNDLEDIDVNIKVKSFHNLRILNISQCAQFKYLFGCHLARTLSQLEHLEISYCDNMEELIHFEKNGVKTITFPKLKVLSLNRLPKLSGLCNNLKVELPNLAELILKGLPNFTCIYPKNNLATSSMSAYTSDIKPFLNEDVGVIPKLEKLHISYMENLKEIWPHQFGTSEEVNVSMLSEIRVEVCDSIVNLFPTNPLPFLCNLKDLKVEQCGSIEVLFNIDLGCDVKVEQLRSNLRKIYLRQLNKLEVLWRIKGVNKSNILISGFQDIEYIYINHCDSFRNIFTPTIVNSDMGSLTDTDIRDCVQGGRNNELVKTRQNQKIDVVSKEFDTDNISNVAIPFYLIHNFLSLRDLELSHGRMEVLFEIKSSKSNKSITTHTSRHLLLLSSSIEKIKLDGMNSMSHVWKCNWKEFLILQRQQPKSSFHNLTRIELIFCHSLKYLFSPFMAILLSNLKEIDIRYCYGMEELVSNRDDEDDDDMTTSISTHTNTTLFPHLDSLILLSLTNLKQIGGAKARSKIEGQFQFSQAVDVTWSLCQYSRKIYVSACEALSSLVPSYAIRQMEKLEELNVYGCKSIMEVFETQGINNSGSTKVTLAIPRPKKIMLKHFNLKILVIDRCDLLEYIFPFSTLESLNQLENLSITRCEAMKVIVKEENVDQIKASNIVVFPRIKRIELAYLPNLEGFFLGMNIDFQWPLLEDVDVKATVKSFCHLQNLTINSCGKLRFLFTCHMATILSYIEHLSIRSCPNVEALVHFENSGEKTIAFPKLKFLSLVDLPKFSCFGNNVHIIELPKLVELHLQLLQFTRIYPENSSYMSVYDSSEIRPFFNRTVGITPNLEKLRVINMKNLKEIWPCQLNSSEEVIVSSLRAIEVRRCDNLENLFPINPMPFLRHLGHLKVSDCGSVEVLFNIDLDCVGNIEQVGRSNLTMIEVDNLGKLREVWKIKGVKNSNIPFNGFQAVEHIKISLCKSFRNICTSTTINMNNCKQSGTNNELANNSQKQQINVASKEETYKVGDSLSNVAFPSYLIPRLRKLELSWSNEMEVLFEIKTSRSSKPVTPETSRHALILSASLEEIKLKGIKSMSHVWKFNWNELLILQRQQLESSFHNLSSIHMGYCESIKCLFSPLMAKLLLNLREIYIENCVGIEEVVSNKNVEDEEMTASISTDTGITCLFPRLEFLKLYSLKNLKHIGGSGDGVKDQSQFSQPGVVYWSLCQYSRKIKLSGCQALSSVAPSYAIGQMHKLEELQVYHCSSMAEVFETHVINNIVDTTLAIPRPQNITSLKLPNLKILTIVNCARLEYMFPFSTLKSLSQLEKLIISRCKAMQVIVKEESGEQTKAHDIVVFSRLRSIELKNLPKLVGFFLGENIDFQWPLLENVVTEECPQLMAFTSAQSAPNLE